MHNPNPNPHGSTTHACTHARTHAHTTHHTPHTPTSGTLAIIQHMSRMPQNRTHSQARICSGYGWCVVYAMGRGTVYVLYMQWLGVRLVCCIFHG